MQSTVYPNDSVIEEPTVFADETTREAIRHSYPASAFRGPLFETRDRISIAMAAVMMLGPLAALPLGF